LAWSAAHLYVREATGHNDGPEIDAWARALGIPLRSPWCGAFQAAGQRACGLPVPPGAGGARNWFRDPHRTYFLRGQRGRVDDVAVAHQVGFYYVNLGRIGHIGQVVALAQGRRRGRPARGYLVRAGNTGSGGGRDGAGVHDLFYAAADVYAAANWLH
jgi:hypothetical protein